MDQWACHAAGDGVEGCVSHRPHSPQIDPPTRNSPGTSDGQSTTASDQQMMNCISVGMQQFARVRDSPNEVLPDICIQAPELCFPEYISPPLLLQKGIQYVSPRLAQAPVTGAFAVW